MLRPPSAHRAMAPPDIRALSRKAHSGRKPPVRFELGQRKEELWQTCCVDWLRLIASVLDVFSGAFWEPSDAIFRKLAVRDLYPKEH